VDSASVDDTGDSSRPAHTRLLAEGILIVEHYATSGGCRAMGSASSRFLPASSAPPLSRSGPSRSLTRLLRNERSEARRIAAERPTDDW
jgi:hypothetical protein